MRRLIAGVGPDGRSQVLEDAPLAPESAGPGFERSFLWETEASSLPPRPPGHGSHFPMDLAPGAARFYVVDQGPEFDVEIPFHHTDTHDVGLVLSGSIELVLDDGTHELHAGDSFVVLGVDHSWKIGPHGCRMCSMSIGTPPPH